MVAGADEVEIPVSVNVDDRPVDGPDPGMQHDRPPVRGDEQNSLLGAVRDIARYHVDPSVARKIRGDGGLI